MFRFPHLGTPSRRFRLPHNESQMIHPTQQLSGSALTKLSPNGAPIVTGHKFKIGQLVVFRLGWRAHVDAARGVFQIIRRLPPTEDGEFQYEIRSDLEEHTRVAGENELTPA
jgi:hypothetical protein